MKDLRAAADGVHIDINFYVAKSLAVEGCLAKREHLPVLSI